MEIPEKSKAEQDWEKYSEVPSIHAANLEANLETLKTSIFDLQVAIGAIGADLKNFEARLKWCEVNIQAKQ